MRRLWTRLGLAALRKEPPAQRNRKGRRLDHSTSVVFLAPGHSPSTRSQLFDLVEGLDGHGDLGSWSLVVDTGMTMKSHAKLRTQKMKKLEEEIPAFLHYILHEHAIGDDFADSELFMIRMFFCGFMETSQSSGISSSMPVSLKRPSKIYRKI